MRRASQVIGDGVCESWKELRMLGILPEPESEDDDECGLCLNTTASVQEESHGGDTVKDVDSVRAPGPLRLILRLQRIY